MKSMIIAALLTIAAAVQAAPITLTIIASGGGGATFTNTVTIKDKYVPQDVEAFADKQGVKPRNNTVRRAGALAKVLLDADINNTLPGLFNERRRNAALSNLVEETSATITEGDE